MKADLELLAESLVAAMHTLDERGLNTGSAGNASVRIDEERFLITPSGVSAASLKAPAVVEMDLSGEALRGGAKPSSEWRMHCDIFAARPEVGAVVHTHSAYATALACRRQEIPSFHYMVAVAGGDSIRCASYATFGTQALSNNALEALVDREACLLANHGVLALASNAERAVNLAVEVEQLAKQYCIALQFGTPVLLDDQEMRDVLEQFKDYGQRIDS